MARVAGEISELTYGKPFDDPWWARFLAQGEEMRFADQGNCPNEQFKKKAAKYFEQWTFVSEPCTDTQFLVGVKPNGNLVIAFRGSDSLQDLVIDISFVAVDWGGISGDTVHGGFWRAWLTVKEFILLWLSDHCSEKSHLLITGHSLGGSLAVLCAAEVLREWTRRIELSRWNIGGKIQVVTFGQPPVGNSQFRKHFDELCRRHSCFYDRYCTKWDMIPSCGCVPRHGNWAHLLAAGQPERMVPPASCGEDGWTCLTVLLASCLPCSPCLFYCAHKNHHYVDLLKQNVMSV